MSAYVIERYLPGLTTEQSSAKATPVAAQRHDAEASVASAWLMICTILGCLVAMMSVVLVAATSMP
jgi:hypothetical protein